LAAEPVSTSARSLTRPIVEEVYIWVSIKPDGHETIVAVDGNYLISSNEHVALAYQYTLPKDNSKFRLIRLSTRAILIDC
jgi:hypothetical protein